MFCYLDICTMLPCETDLLLVALLGALIINLDSASDSDCWFEFGRSHNYVYGIQRPILIS